MWKKVCHPKKFGGGQVFKKNQQFPLPFMANFQTLALDKWVGGIKSKNKTTLWPNFSFKSSKNSSWVEISSWAEFGKNGGYKYGATDMQRTMSRRSYGKGHNGSYIHYGVHLVFILLGEEGRERGILIWEILEQFTQAGFKIFKVSLLGWIAHDISCHKVGEEKMLYIGTTMEPLPK